MYVFQEWNSVHIMEKSLPSCCEEKDLSKNEETKEKTHGNSKQFELKPEEKSLMDVSKRCGMKPIDAFGVVSYCQQTVNTKHTMGLPILHLETDSLECRALCDGGSLSVDNNSSMKKTTALPRSKHGVVQRDRFENTRSFKSSGSSVKRESFPPSTKPVVQKSRSNSYIDVSMLTEYDKARWTGLFLNQQMTAGHTVLAQKQDRSFTHTKDILPVATKTCQKKSFQCSQKSSNQSSSYSRHWESSMASNIKSSSTKSAIRKTNSLPTSRQHTKPSQSFSSSLSQEKQGSSLYRNKDCVVELPNFIVQNSIQSVSHHTDALNQDVGPRCTKTVDILDTQCTDDCDQQTEPSRKMEGILPTQTDSAQEGTIKQVLSSSSETSYPASTAAHHSWSRRSKVVENVHKIDSIKVQDKYAEQENITQSSVRTSPDRLFLRDYNFLMPADQDLVNAKHEALNRKGSNGSVCSCRSSNDDSAIDLLTPEEDFQDLSLTSESVDWFKQTKNREPSVVKLDRPNKNKHLLQNLPVPSVIISDHSSDHIGHGKDSKESCSRDPSGMSDFLQAQKLQRQSSNLSVCSEDSNVSSSGLSWQSDSIPSTSDVSDQEEPSPVVPVKKKVCIKLFLAHMNQRLK